MVRWLVRSSNADLLPVPITRNEYEANSNVNTFSKTGQVTLYYITGSSLWHRLTLVDRSCSEACPDPPHPLGTWSCLLTVTWRFGASPADRTYPSSWAAHLRCSHSHFGRLSVERPRRRIEAKRPACCIWLIYRLMTGLDRPCWTISRLESLKSRPIRETSLKTLSEFILIGEQRGQLPAQSCGCSEIKYNVVTECCWRWRPSVTPRLTAAVEVGVAKAELLIIYTWG